MSLQLFDGEDALFTGVLTNVVKLSLLGLEVTRLSGQQLASQGVRMRSLEALFRRQSHWLALDTSWKGYVV